MMRLGLPLLVGLAVVAAAAQSPADDAAHMRYVRRVLIDTPGRQNFLVVDEATWAQASRDLADLRLRGSDGRPISYARRTRGATHGMRETAARILQPGRLQAQTRFWIEIPDDVREYDRVRLDLRTRDFVALARVEGADDESSREWVGLGEHSLFDFSRERLGSSTVLQLPPTRFRWLRVTVPGDIRPEDVQGAHVPTAGREHPAWLELAVEPDRREDGSRTIFRWNAVAHVPLEGVRVEVPPDQQNFIRRVEVIAGERMIASGTIRRVHRVHGGRTVHFEELDVAVPTAHSDRFELVIHNADDPPLRVARVTPRVLERRLYFDPGPDAEIQLYFGDEDARAPEYEFARLFVEDDGAAPARLGPIAENQTFTPRPDPRPWTERHPAVLWTALVVAVLTLGLLAVRALRQV